MIRYHEFGQRDSSFIQIGKIKFYCNIKQVSVHYRFDI